MQRLVATTAAQMRAVGAAVGRVARRGDVVCLRGHVGAGKTVFAQGLVRAVVGDPALAVPSPTFAVEQQYGPLSHIDLYRLDGPEQVASLGLFAALSSRIFVVEWPDLLDGSALVPPQARLDVEIALDADLDAADPEADLPRRVALAGGAGWQDRMTDLASSLRAP